MKNSQKVFIAPLLIVLSVVIIVGGAFVYVNKNHHTIATPTISPITLSVSDILKASYVISANSAGEIPVGKIVFPTLTSNDGQWLPGLTGTIFIYQDGTQSATNLVAGKDYEAFWIYKYEFNADHSKATVYISGNFVGKGNDNRVFSVEKTNGNVVTKEQASGSAISNKINSPAQ